jgi:hypothetical protein
MYVLYMLESGSDFFFGGLGGRTYTHTCIYVRRRRLVWSLRFVQVVSVPLVRVNYCQSVKKVQ